MADRSETGAQGAPSASKLILAIETSCDETAAAIVNGEGQIIADVVASQIDFHARFGGVVPEIASRKHIEAIAGVALECLYQARAVLEAPDLKWSDLAAVSVTYAPGLVGALVVGVAFAKGLAWSCDLPLVGVNHLEGHIYANKLASPDIQPPMVVSLVSGGHTMLVEVKDWGNYTTLGSTLDDAVGEAFDKVAKALGLGYPGGPLISRLAEEGDPNAIKFPRALLHSGDYDFSLSGLKTAVLTYLQKEEQAGREWDTPNIAASFQQAVIEVQVAKARAALEQTGAKEFCLGGGVAANPALRAAYEDLCAEMGIRLTMPPLKACTDNASMIALVGLARYDQGRFFDYTCDVAAHTSLDDPY
ncbi:tRNA (adenosine(37)-N6)-threonylcarbamoyltransferase complex transferase subunit TsaD [Anaerotardibacter muris]|uniref:tRNA (adenosine(37)-N6)-threonylcarbamoyltransferase complex transferase subunit TsaD n=1 Tax=Anaerotardibacter muris TaxID=2941505 RepID=UPI003B848EBB